MLPKTNINFSVYKLVNTSGKKSYSVTPTYTSTGFIYTPAYLEATELYEVEGAKGVFRIITEQSGIEENDKVKDTTTNKEYKVLKSDTKDTNNVRTTFYQILLTSKI